MPTLKLRIGIGLLLASGALIVGVSVGESQTRRHIKVVLDSQQSETHNREQLQGSGSVIIRKGSTQPSGRVTAGDRQTTVQRTSGIFTLVLDGGESILTVASRVPQSQISYYYNYAIGVGSIERRIVFNDVGTSYGSAPRPCRMGKSSCG